MATTCRTASGDVLDTICQSYYGHLNGTVEAVLDANRGWRMRCSLFGQGW